MKARKPAILALGALGAYLAILGAWIAPEAMAVGEKPGWEVGLMPLPSNFNAGSNQRYLLLAHNVGTAPTTAPTTLKVDLPTGIAPISAGGEDRDPESANPTCTPPVGQTITCETTGPLHPGRWVLARLIVAVSPGLEGSFLAEGSVSGGGAATATTIAPTKIAPDPPDFGFTEGKNGFSAVFTNIDGSAPTQAGSHPDQLTLNFGFPVDDPNGELTSADHVHEVRLDLPPGLIGNPVATPVLCTEAELTGFSPVSEGCPAASQVGRVSVVSSTGSSLISLDPLYNMVPPPGVAAEFGFDAIGVGIYVHPQGEVRSESDYGVRINVKDILAFPRNPVLGSLTIAWGDPSAKSHDQVRSQKCIANGGSCPVDPQKTALISMPGHCSGPLSISAAVDSWEAMGAFLGREEQFEDLAGNPISLGGCNALEFEPTIKARPTTNLTDSPAGLDFTLRQPQQMNLEGLAKAALKDATITLPEGLVVNPSAAVGQGACEASQIGLLTGLGQPAAHFSKAPPACPDNSKVGTVEVSTPLLAQVDPATHKVIHDTQGNPVPRTVEGSVYLAQPFSNPFNSLIALYIAVEDPQSGTFAKLASQITPDPQTGRLTGTLTESPELPLSEASLHFFAGSRAPLRTPPACGAHATASNLTPWNSPQGPTVTPGDSFDISAAASGGPCPATADAAPHQPSFTAGTLDPRAGAFAPFAMKVAREDGSQQITGFEATLPAGLSAKLTGVPYCSEAQIAAAQARKNPNEGALEKASPSCPAASEIGMIDIGAGAGPTQSIYYTTAHAYLAGPYKGAPLSLVVIAPAVAGPFDLGTVVVRAALHVDRETARVRAVSDPPPQILYGIPLDVRSIAVKVDRPGFSLNPTSCEPKETLATAISTFGQPASLASPFSLGECEKLAFKPKLALALKGQTKRTGHPALTGTLTPGKGAQANLKRMAVTLPRSEFLDQAHIGTVCTRVQFKANQCPAGSIYGKARVFTPLLDQPLEGPVFLRSSSHELPDVVLDLHGQVDVALVGRVDSVNGGIRTTFEEIPDAPFTKATLQMRGGKKSLLINSVNLCKLAPADARATVKSSAQNGRRQELRPLLKSDCKGKGKGGKGKGR